MAWNSDGFEGLKLKEPLRTPHTACPRDTENLLGEGVAGTFDSPGTGSLKDEATR